MRRQIRFRTLLLTGSLTALAGCGGPLAAPPGGGAVAGVGSAGATEQPTGGIEVIVISMTNIDRDRLTQRVVTVARNALRAERRVIVFLVDGTASAPRRSTSATT